MIGFNVLVVSPVFMYLDNLNFFYYTFSMEEVPCKFLVDLATLTIVWQVTLFMLAEDFTFYWLHSTLHHPKLYWIHKNHHEYNRTISITAEYSHPI